MQFFYFVDGERKGPTNAAQLKTLAALGKISKETEIELGDGRRVPARKIKGLVFKGETPETKVEEATDAGDIYGVVEPTSPTGPTASTGPTAPTGPTSPTGPTLPTGPTASTGPTDSASSAPTNESDLLSEILDGAPTPTSTGDVPVPAPLPSQPGAAPFPPQPVALPQKPASQGKFGASVVLFALSAVFLAVAFFSAIVGVALSRKAENAANAAKYASSATSNAAPNDARLNEFERKRKNRAEYLEKYDLEETEYGTMRGTEVELLAYEAATDWQKAALEDARRRPSASTEAYMAALDRLNFDRHEFVGGDAYNYEVNASLFTGLAALGVGTDVRDVGDKVKTIETNLRAVGTDVRNVRSEVRSASAVIAAGAGFVCAALFASTSALLFGLGLLARRS